MDTVLQQQMLTLLRGALNQESVSLDTSVDFAELVQHAQRHGIENMLYFGAAAAGMSKSDPQMQALLRKVGERIFVTENQIAEAEAVCAAFDQAGIDYLPVKGMVLRSMYPNSDMRTMGDVDILIRTEQQDAINQLMPTLGFVFVLESAHECNWGKPGILYMELHKSLFADYETDLYPVFGNGWNLAKQEDATHRYTLSPEDHFLYVFVHFAKHYRGGGVGLRHLSDVAVMLKNGHLTDYSYIEQQLRAMDMLDFYRNVLDVIDVWLGDGMPTEKTDFILREIWGSGVYGTHEGHLTAHVERAASGAVENAKRNYAWKLLFPSYREMALKYPFLKKASFLMPFMWPVRWITAGLLRPRHAAQRYRNMQAVSTADIANRQEALRFVGLKPTADRK